MSNCTCNSGQPSNNGGVTTVTPGGLETPFDRVTYRDGQLLTAADLADDLDRNRRLRQLHTHYLHDTWGIAIGYGVSGKDGDNAVQVGPGYAVDQQGRELVLVNTTPIPVPSLNGPILQVLTMRYRDDSTFQKLRNAVTACHSGGSDALTESPAFDWKLPDDLVLGQDVPLLSAYVNNGAIVGALDKRVRRYAQKLMRPYIATGATDAGRTGWKLPASSGFAHSSLVATGGLLLYTATIPTGDAGFNSTPFYFPVLHKQSEAALYGLPGGQTNMDVTDFADPLSFLDNENRASFNFNVFAPRAVHPEEAGWTVSWVGVEPVGGCIPQFVLLEAFFRFSFLFQRARTLVRV
jgi:hypothetical protein